jgi:hypothetical protein
MYISINTAVAGLANTAVYRVCQMDIAAAIHGMPEAQGHCRKRKGERKTMPLYVIMLLYSVTIAYIFISRYESLCTSFQMLSWPLHSVDIYESVKINAALNNEQHVY